MNRTARLLLLFGVLVTSMALYSPAKVDEVEVFTTQSNSEIVPSMTSHRVRVHVDCKVRDHISLSVECGESNEKLYSPETTGDVIDNEPPICVTEWTFANACRRLTDGPQDDIVRIYDRGRNSTAKRVTVTTLPPTTQLFFTYIAVVPESGSAPFDPTIGLVATGGADADYYWYGDCDDNLTTGTDGFEKTFEDSGAILASNAVSGGCPAFSNDGVNRVRVRVKDETATVCPGDFCNETEVFVEVFSQRASIGAFTPSVNSGPDPLNNVEFLTTLDPALTSLAGGLWDLDLACSSLTYAACGVSDTDCGDLDGCCSINGLTGTSYNTTAAAGFHCNYTPTGMYNPRVSVSPAGLAGGTGITDSRSVTVTVGNPTVDFVITPAVTPTNALTGATFTLQNPTCGGSATGAITAGTLDWDIGDATAPVAVALDTGCLLTGGPYTTTFAQSGPKTLRLCATRSGQRDCGDTNITVDPSTTLSAVITAIPQAGVAPMNGTDISVDFTGTCAGTKTITQSSCGPLCTGSFNVTNTAADPYVKVDACGNCTAGTSTPVATIACTGAPTVPITGTPISIGTLQFGVVPVPSATAITAGTNVSLPVNTGVSCSGNATGAVTAVTASPPDPPILGITMEKGVDPMVDATINFNPGSGACLLASSHGKTYTTTGPKIIEVCAIRQGVVACGTATVTVNPAQTTNGVLTPSDLTGENGVHNGIDFTIATGGTCPGPWTISNGDCGTAGTPTNGGINGTFTSGAGPTLTLTDRCNYTTTPGSIARARISCGTATPYDMSSQPIVVTGAAQTHNFTLTVDAVPATGAATVQPCDTYGCRLLVNLATSCGGSATGHIKIGTVNWLPPQPSPFAGTWYEQPVEFDANCNAKFLWDPTGKPHPPGIWNLEVCTGRRPTGPATSPTATDYITACDTATVNVTTPTQTGANFEMSGAPSGVKTRGDATYAQAIPTPEPIIITNTGNATGSFTCGTNLAGVLPVYPFETILGGSHSIVAGKDVWKGTLAPGGQGTLQFTFDHRGADGVAGTSANWGDDVAVGTHTAILTCKNDANASDAPSATATVTINASATADLEMTGGTTCGSATCLSFVVTEGIQPVSQSVYLFSRTSVPASFSITNPIQPSPPGTFVNCALQPSGQTGGGTAPGNASGGACTPSTCVEYRCTPASNMTRAVFGTGTLTTTKTFTRQ